jgi:hypothetical protein
MLSQVLVVAAYPRHREIPQVSVARAIGERDPRHQFVGHQRRIHGDAVLAQAVVAERGVERTAELGFRLAGDDVDGSRHGVAPEQRALRATKDLEGLEVELALAHRRFVTEEHLVDVETDARVAAGPGRGEASDAELAVRAIAVVERDAWEVGAEIAVVPHAAAGQLVARERRDRHGDVQRRFRAFARRHDNLLERQRGL